MMMMGLFSEETLVDVAVKRRELMKKSKGKLCLLLSVRKGEERERQSA